MDVTGTDPRRNALLRWFVLIVTMLLCGFYLLLMVWAKVSGVLQMLVVLCGLIVLLRFTKIDREELHYMSVMTVLPALYVLLMALHGGHLSFLERPLLLLWCVPVFLLLRRIPIDFRVVLGAISVGLFLSLPLAAYERFALDEERVFGVYAGGDYGNMVGIYAAVSCVGLITALSGPQRQWRTAALCSAVIISGCAIALWSGSRTAWLIIAAGVLVGGLMAMRVHRLRSAGFTLLIVLALYGGVASVESTRQRIALAVAEFSGYLDPQQRDHYRVTSVGLRLESLRFGIELFEQAPWLGIGIAGYREQIRKAVAEDRIPPQMAGFSRGLHNQLLDHMVLGGVVGLTAVLVFWGGLTWLALRWFKAALDPLQRFFALALLVVTLGYFIVGLLGSLFGSLHGTRTIAMLWATLAAFAAPRTNIR